MTELEGYQSSREWTIDGELYFSRLSDPAMDYSSASVFSLKPIAPSVRRRWWWCFVSHEPGGASGSGYVIVDGERPRESAELAREDLELALRAWHDGAGQRYRDFARRRPPEWWRIRLSVKAAIPGDPTGVWALATNAFWRPLESRPLTSKEVEEANDLITSHRRSRYFPVL